MGDLEVHFLHAFDHRRRGCRAGSHHLHHMIDAGLHLIRGVLKRVQYDRRPAEVIDLLLLDQVENHVGADLAQADIDTDGRGDGPGETPTVAVKHWQGPQIDRVQAHIPYHRVANRIQVGPTVVVDHAFGIAGGAGSVVQGNGLPLVGRGLPSKIRVTFGKQSFVIQLSLVFAADELRVIDIDHQRALRWIYQAQRLADGLGEFTVGEQKLGLTVFEHERNRFGIQTNIQRVEHRSGHRDAEVQFKHLGNVG